MLKHAGKSRAISRRLRRAAAYVFVLTTATLVAVIGLSALTVARIRQQGAEGANQSAATQVIAQSAIEQALLSIYIHPGWRSNLAHDNWSAGQSCGSGSFRWKIVDPVNGNLTADRNAPVRIYGQSVSGGSVWVYSVLAQPPPEVLPAELLTNGNLESGAVTPWLSTGCSLKLDSAVRRSGNNSLLLWSRSSTTASARQTITTKIQSDTTYRVRAWIRTRLAPETINVNIRLQTAAGYGFFPITTLAGTTSWQQVDATVTPYWSGALIDAYLEFVGTTTMQEVLIDDASMTRVLGPVGIIPGTWRREAQ